MSDTNALQQATLESLGFELAELGFKRRRADQTYRRKTVTGWGSLHLSFIRIRSAQELDIAANMSVRLDAVQRFLESDVTRAATIGVDLGNWTTGVARRWSLKNEQDVERVVSELKIECRSVVVPFIDQFSSLDSCFETLAKEDRRAILLCSSPVKRALVCIALAILTNRNPDAVIDQWQSLMSTKWPHELESFMRKLAWLQEVAKG